MTHSTRSRLLIAVLCLGLLAQGCAPAATSMPQPTVSPVPSTATPQPTPTPAPTSAPAGVTLTDAVGKTVHFDKLPQRIVIGGRNALPVTESLFLFPEAAQRVVSYSIGGKQNPAAFIGSIYPSFKDKPTLETSASAEQIVAMQPEVVVMKSVNAQTLGEPLSKLGIPVVNLDLETPEAFYRDIATLGQLLGNTARSQQILAYYESKLAAIDQAMQGVGEANKPTAMLMQYSLTGGEIAVSVPPASWLQTLMVEMAGAKAVWKDATSGSAWSTVNLEQVAAWNPDVILVVDYTTDSREAVAKLKADARWQALAAVKKGTIYGFPADFFSWDQPDPRWILGMTWLAGKLYPARFPGLDTQQQVVTFFVDMYGMDKAAVEANIVPVLKGDWK